MRFCIFIISLLLVTSAVVAQSQPGPVVEELNPKTASINSIVELKGYRLYPEAGSKTNAFFIQNGVELPAQTGGGSSVTNNERNGAQSLAVFVPDGIVPGLAQIVVEVNGQRSIPATVTITEWQLPIIKRVNPTRGAPGTFVEIEGEGFHVDDEIEVTDTDGNPVRRHGGGSSQHPAQRSSQRHPRSEPGGGERE